MQTISWNHDLKLGIKAIDVQHRKMISIANEFINAANQRSEATALAQIITRLREQAVTHLSAEEKLMASTRYRHRSIRSLENERFKVALKRFQRQLHTKGTASVKDVQFLRQSLVRHIKGAKQAIIASMSAHYPRRVSLS